MPTNPVGIAVGVDNDDLIKLDDIIDNQLLADMLVGFAAEEDVFGQEVRLSSMSHARGLLNVDELSKGLRFFGSRRDKELVPMVMGSVYDLEKLIAGAQPKSIVDLLTPTDDLPVPDSLAIRSERPTSPRGLLTVES